MFNFNLMLEVQHWKIPKLTIYKDKHENLPINCKHNTSYPQRLLVLLIFESLKI